jgi:hypothetical protein
MPFYDACADSHPTHGAAPAAVVRAVPTVQVLIPVLNGLLLSHILLHHRFQTS